jgi:hypothetical protein
MFLAHSAAFQSASPREFRQDVTFQTTGAKTSLINNHLEIKETKVCDLPPHAELK